MNTCGFALHVSAEVPGVFCIPQQRRTGALLHVLAPGARRFLGRLDRSDAVVAHVRDALGDPFYVLLDRDRHVGEHRRASGTGDGKEIRIARHLQTEIGPRPRLPVFPQQAPVAAADVHSQQRAGERIETGGEDDDVQRVLARLRADALEV
jgi:hypothetical protein